jgi:pimeloyl-ACP methyl ester carboxylesterase
VGSIEIRSASGRKVPIHFGTGARALFGFYHPPAGGLARAAGVILCSPIGTDQTRSARTYRHLAERLSAAGFPCLRFDLFGTGDSGGDERGEDLWRGWIEDVGTAIAELRARAGVGKVALVGLRVGGTLACLHAVESGGVDTLVLWNPCVSGAEYLAEVTRLHKLYTRIEPQMSAAPPLQSAGAEALGSYLSPSFMADLFRVDLLQAVRRPAQRALVVDGGNFPRRDALLTRLRDLGVAPDLACHPGHKFLVTVSHRSTVPEDELESVVRWLTQAYGADEAPRAPETSAPFTEQGTAPFGERAVVFGPKRPLFGILTPADPARTRPNRPGIVLANAGCVDRVGPHRLYVTMARRWAALGFDVLRVDLSGIGDSPAAPGTRENLTYPESGEDDLGEAMRALETERAIVAGLCSGGDYAFRLGARDPHVVGAWLMNPRTFCVLELAAVESGTPPASPVSDVPRTLNAMVGRGVDTLLVVSKNDPGVAYVDTHAARDMRALADVAGFRRVDLEGSDHSFTPVEVQRRVSDRLTEQLARWT